MCFFNVKKGSIQGLICFKLVLGFWSLDPCLKWPLRCKVSQKSGFHIAKFGIASCGHNQCCNFSVLTFWKLEPAGKCKAYVFSKSKNKFWHNRTCLDHYHGPRVLRKQRTGSKNLYTLNHQLFFVGSFMRSVSSLENFKKPGSEGLFWVPKYDRTRGSEILICFFPPKKKPEPKVLLKT
jgi:hypothetical protein